MPKISFECTPEEAIELFQKAGPLQTEMIKTALNILAENPEMAFKLGAANAAYFRGASQSLLENKQTPTPPLPSLDLFYQLANLWMPKPR